MNQRSKYLFKNVGVLTLSNIPSKILIFLLVPLYTSVLSTAEYGTYDLVVSTVSLLYPILTANIVDAVMRFLMDKDYSRKTIATIGIRIILIGIFIVGFALIILNKWRLIESIYGLEIYIFLYYTTYVLNQFFIQFSKGVEHVTDMAIAGILGTLATVGANVLFLLVFKWGLKGFFVANILAQAIPILYYFFRLKFWEFLEYKKIDSTIRKDMLKYCVPLILATLGWWVNSASDKYVVTFFCGVAANGILSVAYKIPSIINTLQSIFIQAWQISAIKEYKEQDVARFYGQTFLSLNLFMAVACAVLILLSKPLAYLFYANEFYSAWQYVPFLMISSVFNSASGFLGPILAARKDSKAMAMSAVYGASINIVLNIILIYCMGVQGATIATAIASFTIYYVRKKAVRDDIQIDKYWLTLVTWILLCIQAVIEIYTPFWFLEIIAIILLLLLNKSTIKGMVKVFIKR